MEISSSNQLIPYFQGTGEVTLYRREESEPPTAYGYPTEARNATVYPPIALQNAGRPQEPESMYNSSRRVTSSKLKRIGLRIDVYA